MPDTHARTTDKASARAALILGLCLPGDTLLYLLLPMQHEAFGVTLAEAGLLLAANRLVRIFGYSHVMRFYARRGDRPVCVLAAFTAALCALGYATLSGFWWLLLLRLGWGLTYAALNLSTQVMATAEPTGAARRTGHSRALIATGPMLALPLGALVSVEYGPRVIFLLMALTSLVALLLAFGLPSKPHPLASSSRRFQRPDSVALWSFIEGLVLDGLFIIGLSLQAEQLMAGNAVLVAGGLLALRYVSEMLLSPLGGLAAQRWGATRMLIVFSLLTSVALVGFGCHWLIVGGALVLVLRALQLPLVVTVVAQRHPGTGRVRALAANAVWRDIGAGVGPLIAGLLLPVASTVWVYSLAAGCLAVSAWACREVGVPGEEGRQASAEEA
ncbi:MULTISPECIES: MFS transporter [Pseudomonas]|uniref:MFS transporter n=1 Tax=Pseudomonas sp. W17 TaxID=3144407 RepID=A0AAU7WS96_9PSED|nr:MFS transporter [Pseudomonas protegens]WRV90490.1 MFS transporter [Pseudomonas protegens]